LEIAPTPFPKMDLEFQFHLSTPLIQVTPYKKPIYNNLLSNRNPPEYIAYTHNNIFAKEETERLKKEMDELRLKHTLGKIYGSIRNRLRKLSFKR
jgi:hypothetical protein